MAHEPLKLVAAAPPPSNVEVVAEALRRAIVDGRLRPGERIKEVPVAERLGVSRGPIREAIRLLEHDGLVRVIPNRGAVVPEPTSADVLEVYAMRSALGSLALQKLMLGADGPPVTALAKELERLRRATERGLAPAAADADLRYQSALVSAAGLPRVSREFDRLSWQVRIFIGALDLRFDDKLEAIRDEVAALHDAIASHDGELAERLWREKFERWVRDFVSQLSGEFDTDLWAALTSGAHVPQIGVQP
jgi:DNA-binding GntR family transcriptional regulator